MDKPVLNKRILSVIEKETSGDIVSSRFINELLFEEIEHPNIWRYKEFYRNKIKEHSIKWELKNEDK